ncbi:hypothetical protein [Acetilactobacillus jinshanensis]|uniref:Uncharacterized protein n=1 Tax=Acetilactobacillus jinshanensis TaxID=1720083 RepID=A0A4P6ZLP4_9LACO|nr:hypothetical protein [Acetilactobacillus jinshanensis]QBP18150.1 hypothetical protein ELX58_03135 [Acetilactobacillus jinshanensis]URL61016.1 hypothetical protein HGK75_03190 [uncultured bacterium]
MDATEATIRTSLHTNIQQMISTFKELKQLGVPKRTDKTKMIEFANAQATLVATQGKISEDLHLLQTLGFMSTDQMIQVNKKLTKQIQTLEKENQSKGKNK